MRETKNERARERIHDFYFLKKDPTICSKKQKIRLRYRLYVVSCNESDTYWLY